MKRIILFLLAVTAVGAAGAQSFDDYRRQRQEEFERHVAQSQERFDRHRDSMNQRYADFLEQRWAEFEMKKHAPLIDKPIVTPPVHDPTEPQPAPQPVVVAPPVHAPVEPQPVVVAPPVIHEPPTPDKPTKPIESTPEPSANTVAATFFGTPIRLAKLSEQMPTLKDNSERAIAGYWRALSRLPIREITADVQRLKTELELNDWGVYKLINQIFATYKPQGSKGEQVVFAIFILNQLDYRAKIGRNNQGLIPLLGFANKVVNCAFFPDRGCHYYAVGMEQAGPVQTCTGDYGDGLKPMQLALTAMPRLAAAPMEKSGLAVNKNVVDFLSDFPCAEFTLYATAPLDPALAGSIDNTLTPLLQGRSQVQAVNSLLNGVQKGFEYQADPVEKFFFAEQTIAVDYSDCEDRAILFSQLVRRVLKMPVVLIYYPMQHLATAVRFDDQTLEGDYVMVDGSKYLICDPTYIGAPLGKAMPDLRNTPIEVLKLR